MRHAYTPSILLAAAILIGCDPVVAPGRSGGDSEAPAFASAHGVTRIDAAGTFAQTSATSVDVRIAGGNTIIVQTATGILSGTLAGPFEDEVRVVIHPNGRFTTKFTITCTCTVAGRSGIVYLNAEDAGELVSQDVATFAGRAVITGATDELAGLGGLLRIAGSVDLASGLSTYDYSGRIHFRP
jgi:hypothetical protein